MELTVGLILDLKMAFEDNRPEHDYFLDVEDNELMYISEYGMSTRRRHHSARDQ